jgi:hypothetical protein
MGVAQQELKETHEKEIGYIKNGRNTDRDELGEAEREKEC